MVNFSGSYKLLLQKRFNYNFSVFRSSNGLFVYGAAYTLFGSKPYKAFSSKSPRSKKRYPIEVSTLKNDHFFKNKRKRFFRGIERFSVLVLPTRGAYGFLDFLPKSCTPTHISVFSKGVSVNPEMVNLSWKMRSLCSYSVWFKIKSENLLMTWTLLRSFQIPVSSVPFEYFSEESV
jgi:hypothetical protein